MRKITGDNFISTGQAPFVSSPILINELSLLRTHFIQIGNDLQYEITSEPDHEESVER